MAFTISRKLYGLVTLAVLTCLVMSVVQLYSLRQVIQSERRFMLMAQADAATAIAKAYVEEAKAGRLTLEEAQARAAKAIGAIRFGAKDYVFVLDDTARMVVHPNAKLIGQTLWEKTDPNGKLLFQDLIARAAEGGGFTPYLWPREGDESPVPKLSYAEPVEGWNWVIGTGVYMDDVEALYWNEIRETAYWLVPLLALIIAVALPVARSISKPLAAITSVMRSLTAGNLRQTVPYTQTSGEIGEMARAVDMFRKSGEDNLVLTAKARADEDEQTAERERRSAIDEANAEDLRLFVRMVETSFDALSQGDLTVRMEPGAAPKFEPIRAKFNDSVAKLEDAIGAVVGAVGVIRNGLGEISVASSDLAQRTEQQAASLEETVAALSEVTRGVNETADRAGKAKSAAGTTRRTAEKSGEIVGRAIEAMSQIEQSSDKIGHIIGVIDEIAFQTNLLALNAGVEAARAGEAGRGFAVVAQEVRGLAQRSAEAAKEIKTLISASTAQVAHGVELVTASGRSLAEIIAEIGEMDEVVTDIAGSAREQAVSLREVSGAADQMDKVTQQNAAMVEETTAAAQTLSNETGELASLVERFRTNRSGKAAARSAPAPRRPASRPVAQMRTTASARAAPAPSSETWDEF